MSFGLHLLNPESLVRLARLHLYVFQKVIANEKFGCLQQVRDIVSNILCQQLACTVRLDRKL